MGDSPHIHYQIIGQGEPLLLLHGFSGCGANFDLMLPELSTEFQCIVPDLRGHGRSTNPDHVFLHRDAARDILRLLDTLDIQRTAAIGVSAGGNVLLHMATRDPDRISAMAIASATPYFPEQCRAAMRQFSLSHATTADWERLRKWHVHGDAQIEAIYAQGRAMADSHDDMNFSPADLGHIRARTLIVQGDRDPLYPVEISVEMYRAIPGSSLWIVPQGGHGPVFQQHTLAFVKIAKSFLAERDLC